MEMSFLSLLLVAVPTLVICQSPTEERDERMPYYILEELPAHTRISNVAIDAKLTEKYDKAVLKNLRYTFLNQANSAGDSVTFFDIEEKSSIVKTLVKIDRDLICAQQITCFVFLDIAVGPADYFQVIKIKVDILDVNDHSPSFPEPEVSRQVSEAISPGTYLSLSTAVDPDSQAFSIQQYELVTNTKKFELRETTGVDGSTDLRLYINEKLDREQADIYQFTVYAHDGGNPPKSGSVLVQVEVQDANDNEPTFDNATYEVYVLENVAAGTTVGRVMASDMDIGTNGHISYQFSERTEKSYGHLFAIRNETGAIYLLSELDFEESSTYLLVVTARDGGADSRPAHATVIVRVEDSNDNKPIITVNTLTTTGVAQIAEHSEVGTFVAHVSVLDQDEGENGQVECSLEHAMFDLEALYESQYKVVTSSQLDWETTKTYELEINCHDKGRTPRSSQALVTVEVLDSNDHPPTFSKDTYYARVTENNYVNDVLLRVNATDVDQGLNGEVKYLMDKDHSDLFVIHPTSGAISAKVVFDREKLEEMVLHVIAYDQGTPSLSSSTTVTLYILDQNDEPPYFEQQSYVFGIFENQQPNTEVGELKASDADTEPYNDFVFLFADDRGRLAETFRIDPISGKIFTRKVLDREREASYYASVVAQSSGGAFPPMSSTVSLTIYVADQNDNDPVIEWPDEQNNSISISNQVPVGHPVLQITAHDDDAGVNAKLTYEISGGNEEDMFSIHPDLGALEVKGRLDSLDYRLFPVTVRVMDGGTPMLSTEVTIGVIVNNSIEFTPPQGIVYTNNNITIIVSLTSASLILIFLLIIAIVLIRKQSKDKQEGAFSCVSAQPATKTRTESQKMLAPREDSPDGAVSSRQNSTTNSEAGVGTKDVNIQLDLDPTSESSTDPQPARHHVSIHSTIYWNVPCFWFSTGIHFINLGGFSLIKSLLERFPFGNAL